MYHNFQMATLHKTSVCSFSDRWPRIGWSYGIVLWTHLIWDSVTSRSFFRFGLWALPDVKRKLDFSTIFDVWPYQSLLVLQILAKSDDFFSGISWIVSQLPVATMFAFTFRSTAAPLPEMATSIPDEYLRCYILTTINPRDSEFGRFIENNGCSNFALHHADPIGWRDLVEVT